MTILDEIPDEEYNRFYKSMVFSMKWEGGYNNDPDDPGGETKWGISKASYPEEDIKNLDPVRAATIYYEDYWLPSEAYRLPFPLCSVVFDTAVLCGVQRAREWLFEASGDPYKLIELRRGFHVERVKKKPSQGKWLGGWLNRVNDLVKLVDIHWDSPSSGSPA